MAAVEAGLLSGSALNMDTVNSSSSIIKKPAMAASGAVAAASGASCLELAMEGERLCKAGDCRNGVHYFEAAVQVGTDDLKTLSAIYSQLGNAYFYLQEYGKALEYHKHDLNLARTIGDKLGEAKASGNLGNTLKVLGKFDEAIACCQRHLDLARELADRIGEARALYNLGNVYHSKGKHAGRGAAAIAVASQQQQQGADPAADFPPTVKSALEKAAEYYETNLTIVRELNDRAAQGRACGNLGNTHYLLGNHSTAIKYHEERLAIAKEFGDKAAERRAYSNLGNAHIFLGNFEVAAESYKRTLLLAKQLGDRALEAQACYSLGNTYTLLRHYATAVDYHLQHLLIARELHDRMGEGRACWSLGNAHAALGDAATALDYAAQHLAISQEIGDQMGEATAQLNLQDLRASLGLEDPSPAPPASEAAEALGGDQRRPAAALRRQSMEQLQLMRLTPDKAGAKAGGGGARPRVQKAYSVATELPEKMLENCSAQQNSAAQRSHSAKNRDKAGAASDGLDNEDFFDLLSRYQSRRIDDQRCSFRSLPGAAEDKENATPPAQRREGGSSAAHDSDDAFLDMVAGIQGSRMNDQRAELPTFPGLNNSEAVIGPMLAASRAAAAAAGGAGGAADDSNDDFLDMLMRCQSSRLEDQRSSLPAVVAAPTVPDEDFFTLIQRVQSNRLDEQRSHMPDTPQLVLPHMMPPKAEPAAAAVTQKRPSKKKKDKKEK